MNITFVLTQAAQLPGASLGDELGELGAQQIASGALLHERGVMPSGLFVVAISDLFYNFILKYFLKSISVFVGLNLLAQVVYFALFLRRHFEKGQSELHGVAVHLG